MLHAVALAAHRLDEWLQARLGRPYNTLLGVGLTIEIVRRLMELPHHAAMTSRLMGVIVMIVLNLALLVHQVGELSRHTKATRDGRGSKGAARRS